MSTSDRDVDIVLFGATGFAGRLTALHLAAEAPPEVRIALAGRSRERLAAVAAELGDAAAGWPLLVVDATDEDAVADLAARTRVVVSTVGPYVKFGTALVAACAAAGTHYCDLTGEVLFVHRSIADNHELAQRTGARIVHSCGFDSVPSDLGVMLTAESAASSGATLGRTRLAVRSMKGGASGGTIDSMRGQVDEMRADPSTRPIVADPWALADGGAPARPTGARPDRPGGLAGVLDTALRHSPVKRDEDNGHFTGPFVMATFNTRIVARSASLLGYGPDFRYAEYSDYGSGPKGAVTAAVVSVGLGGTLAGMAFAPTRAVLDRVLPKPGEGPSEKTMAAGRFRMEVTGEASDGSRHRTTVAAPYDPGYTGTAVMLGQSALALAQDTDSLPVASGVLTPASAIGAPLVERLRAHRFTLETERLAD